MPDAPPQQQFHPSHQFRRDLCNRVVDTLRATLPRPSSTRPRSGDAATASTSPSSPPRSRPTRREPTHPPLSNDMQDWSGGDIQIWSPERCNEQSDEIVGSGRAPGPGGPLGRCPQAAPARPP